jgi:hypothetical protein
MIALNKVVKSKGDGIMLSHIAVSKLDIMGNESSYNGLNAISVKEMHQKSNKFKFKMTENKFRHSEKGYGAYI